MRILFIVIALLCSTYVSAADGKRSLGAAAGNNAEQRIALVIGNSSYAGAPLANPVNDARDMAAALRSLGFQVIEKTNVTQKELNRAIGDFGSRLRTDSIALFFYAGHGIQVKGKNYLVPIDAEIISEASVRTEAVDVDGVLDQLAASPLNIVILDACRNNPFERRFRSAGGGLAQMDAPKGSLIAYATAPGKVASDGSGRNGLYTQELLKALHRPGMKVEDVFKQVRINVAKASGDNQIPWEASSLTGDFYFREGQQVAQLTPTTTAARTPQQIEDELWDGIKGSDKAAVFEEYIRQYPRGRYLPQAKIKLAELRQTANPPPAPSVVPVKASPSGGGIPGSAATDGTEEARRHILRGTAAAEMAKSQSDLADAAREFRKATELAPSMANAWFNLAIVESKLGQYASAIASYQRYLALAPGAADTQKIQNEIVKLEYQQERTAKRDKLIGVWTAKIPTGFSAGPQFHTEVFKVALEGTEFRMEPQSSQRWLWREFKLYTPDGGKLVPLRNPKIDGARLVFAGRLDGDRIVGERIRPGYFDTESKCRVGDLRTPFEGRIEENGEVLVVTFDEPRYKAVWDYKSYFSSSGEIQCLRVETDPPERQEFRMTRSTAKADTIDPFFGNYAPTSR